ncbi:MAG: flagellar M-ring protein FliF C-terminal domain-containing protein, partial [bacterium]
APGKDPPYGTAAGGPGATSYNKTEQLTNFQIATQQTDTHDPGNAVRRIAVTVFVDSSVSADVAVQITKAIQEGYLDPKRGDAVSVTRVAFWAGKEAPAPAPSRAKLVQQALPIPVLAGAGGGLIVLVLAMLLLLRRRRPAPPAAPQPVAVPVAARGATADPSPAAKGVVEWVKQNPAVAAEVVHRWVGNGSTKNGGGS